ncbi:MAG: hypothetical protein IKM61_05325 [Eubacteriaceae bacterium]|nr:hypothetical protein [Eubacteriaceae bacterium]
MQFFVQLKKAGKKENKVVKGKLILECNPKTVGELIAYTVRATLNSYNDKLTKSASFAEGDLSDVLIMDEDDIRDKASTGKVGFGMLKMFSGVSEEKAVKTAKDAFNDGIVAVFIDSKRYEDIDEELSLAGGETFTFVMLTMLAGRMW